MSLTKDPVVNGKLLSSLRVVDLKEELEKRSLSKSGTKKDLADRLRTYVLQHEVKAPPPPPPAAPPPVLDEDELPSISMQEKQLLEEKNPFLRDYFASQAELFHSQKVAKKLLLEEEARRESETSAPSADESSAAEDKDLNSSTEEVSSGKVKQLARRFEKNSSKESPPKKEEPVLISTPAPTPTQQPLKPVELEPIVQAAQPLKSTRQRQLEKLAKTTAELNKGAPAEQLKLSSDKPAEITMVGKVVDEKPLEEPKQVEEGSPASSRSSSRSASRSRSRSGSGSDHEQTKEIPHVNDAKPVPEKEVTVSQSETREEKLAPVGSNGNVRKLTERFENKAPDDTKSVKTPSPAKKVDDSLSTEPETVLSKKLDDTKQETEESRSSSPSSSSSGSRSPSPEKEPTEQYEERSPQPKEDEDTFQNGEPLSKVARAETTTVKPANNVAPLKKPTWNKLETKPEPKAIFTVPAPRNNRIISAPAEEDEEMLDYGEEDKIQMEPQKFDWTRRVLRLKNTHVTKTREHKWRKDVGQKSTENINSELMSEWFADVRLSPAVEFKTENKSPEAQEENDTRFTRTFSMESEEGGASIKMENITITRTVSLIPMQITTQNDDDADKDLSPARNSPSEVILVSNLTRPFTLPQLRELLQRTGNLEDLWVDKIKSKCIAKYEKEEEAFETRAALHGIKWPSSNPKALHVDYSTHELLDEYKARDAGEFKPSLTEKPVTADNLPVREWDMGKRAKSRSPKRRRSRSTSRDRKRSRRSPSPRRHSRSPLNDRRSRGDAKGIEPLGKALDELFRKTVATPSIYWLPLTAAQIAEKEEMRRKRMIERERRLAELSKPRPR